VYFDLSVFDVYAGIASGSTLIIVPDALLMFPKDLMDLIDREGVTVWNSVPSLMSYISKMNVLRDDCCDSLKQILFCGEVMPTATVMDWMRVYPRKQFFNLYGPTETTCESMVYPILERPSDPTIPLPIGKACANTEVFALTEDLKLASPGEEGELYIRGASVGLGYWRDPEKTAAAFVRSPLHPGNVERVYATGDVVRLRADENYDFVGDVESALGGLDGVVESAVIAVRDETAQTTKIIGFVFPGRTIGAEELRERLKIVLPPYMIPKEIHTVAGPLPRTPNGKIDRNLLRDRYGREAQRRDV
jgi:L-proline---[L-prolyl-carrier protein] ligase